MTLLPIGGLVDGVTYYVRFISTTSFSLALMPTGGVHTLDATGRTATNHAIGTEGIDLGAAGGAHRLHLDLPRTGIVADAELRGAGGADLLQALSLKADGQSTARAQGGSGAIIDASEPRSKTTLTANVLACVGFTTSDSTCGGTGTGATPTTITAGGAVSVKASSDGKVSDYTDVRNGGGLRVGVARDKATITLNTLAIIGARSVVQAGGDVTIEAKGKGWLRVEVISAGGGVIAVSDADASGVMTLDTRARVDTFAVVDAAGNVAVLAENSIEGLVQLESFSAGGLFWSSADANHSNISEFTPAGLSITNDALVEIGSDAVVTGRTARLEARTTQIKGTVNAGALAFIVMLIGVSKAYAEANIGIRSDTNVVIKPRAKVTGFQGVDIRARTDDITLLRRASRLGVGLFPPQAAVAGFCDGNNGSCWEAVPNASEGWNTGSMVVHTTVDADADAHITAGVRPATGGPLDHPAQGGTNGNYPALALFVEAFTANPSDTTGEFKVWTSSIGGDGSFDHYRGSVQHSAEIKWDADVTVLGGGEGEPVLVVDGQGIVQRVNGVKLRCDAVQTTGPCTTGVSEYTPTVNASVDPDGNGSYTIADIVNGGFGNVLMSARSTSSDAIRNETSTDAAGWPLFDFKVTLPGVTIVDRSGLNVTINKVDVVKPFSATVLPIVWLISDDDEAGPANNVYQLEFDVQQSAGDAFVDIQKFGAALLTLNGAINNPAGWTRIFSVLGDIASSNATVWITTNTLDLVALAGAIGGTGTGQRINIQLVQSLDRGVLAIATDDRTRSTQLFAEANGLSRCASRRTTACPATRRRSSCTSTAFARSRAPSTCCSKRASATPAAPKPDV